jgi:hypothetical protein
MIIKMTESEYVEHVEENNGICLKCGDITCGGVEPDATNYMCESCNRHGVYGIEVALMSGYIEFIEKEG